MMKVWIITNGSLLIPEYSTALCHLIINYLWVLGNRGHPNIDMPFYTAKDSFYKDNLIGLGVVFDSIILSNMHICSLYFHKNCFRKIVWYSGCIYQRTTALIVHAAWNPAMIALAKERWMKKFTSSFFLIILQSLKCTLISKHAKNRSHFSKWYLYITNTKCQMSNVFSEYLFIMWPIIDNLPTHPNSWDIYSNISA